MNKLDLHGLRHDDIERVVENFVLLNNPPLTIITGNSDMMKRIVIETLNKHNIHYEQWGNQGEYKVL